MSDSERDSPLSVVNVLAGPSWCDGGLARIARMSDGSGRVEVWSESESAWVPSEDAADVADVMRCPPCGETRMVEAGIELGTPDAWAAWGDFNGPRWVSSKSSA